MQDTDDANDRRLSRRTFLTGLAGVGGGSAVPQAAATAPSRTPSAEEPDSLSVMTRNLYLGADLSRLFEADSLSTVRSLVGELFADVQRRPFPPRAAAIADEIAATRPDVIGLQEAPMVRTQRPGDFTENPSTNASSVDVDFLEVLTAALAARNLPYAVAASTVTTDIELPAAVDGERIDVRLTDRDAILVHADVSTGATRTGTYDAVYTPPEAPGGLGLRRGYCLLDVVAGGVTTTVATTHLAATDGAVRARQAEELLDVLPTDRPVVLAGDLNSGPGGPRAVYDLLLETFTDAFAAVRPDAAGFTCCQAPDLRNDRSRLARRVDSVLVRDGLEPTDAQRVGAEPTDRVTAEVDGESVELWPSDHAGVVATADVTATPTVSRTTTAAATPTRTQSSATTRETETAERGPGFGAGAALVGGGVLLLRLLDRLRR